MRISASATMPRPIPGVVRDWTYYAAGMIQPFRLLVEEVQPIPGRATLGGAMTVAFPGFWKL